MIHKGQNHIPVKQQPFAFARVGHIGELVGRDIQLCRKNLTVPGGLVQHIDKVRVLKDVFHLTAGKQILDVLSNAGGNPAVLPEALPNLHGIGRCLFLLQQQVELVHIVPGGLAGGAVCRDPAPDLILHNEHTQLLELFAQILDVIAHQPVLNVHIGAVVKEIQTALDVDLQSSRHTVGLLFLLGKQGVVEVLQNGHILRGGMLKIVLVNLVDTAVNDRFLNGLQALLAADDQLAQGENEV